MMTRDVTVELKQLRLHGMAGARTDLVEQGSGAGLDSSRALIEHLLQAEGTDRATRPVSHQMHAARFPVHRDLAGFDFEVSPVDRELVGTLVTMAFTEDAHHVVLVGRPGTASVCGSTQRSTRSTRWSKRRRRARSGASRQACCAWTGSSSNIVETGNDGRRQEAHQAPRAAGKDLHLSPADRSKVGFHPWLNIRPARWLRFESAPTP